MRRVVRGQDGMCVDDVRGNGGRCNSKFGSKTTTSFLQWNVAGRNGHRRSGYSTVVDRVG